MIHLNALELLRCHTSLPFGWCEVVVGYDFGLLSIREIQDWVRSLAPLGPEGEHVAGLAGPDLMLFEESLWAACVEATGARVPRPGHQRWALAQDLWRTALLKETLAWPLGPAAFADAIAIIIDRVGCPEDMLGLLRTSCCGPKKTLASDRTRVEAFVQRLESGLPTRECEWLDLAAS